MNKNSSKKSKDENLPALISPERAKNDLAKFIENNKYLITSVKQTQENIRRMIEILDLKGMQERMILPLKLLSGLPEQIKSLSNLFEIPVPKHFYDGIEDITNREKITFTPRNDAILADIRMELIEFSQKLKNKLEEKFVKLSEAIDKNAGSYRIKLVNDRSAHCKFCGHLLMKVQYMLYFGKASMKCPNCKKVVQIPKQLNFKEL